MNRPAAPRALSRHSDNGPAVLYPAGLQRLLADRSRNSVRNGSDAIIGDALGHEIITDRAGSPLSERLVRPGVSPLVRMALDEDAHVPLRCEPRGGPIEVTPRRRTELGTARVEVGDDDLKARRRHGVSSTLRRSFRGLRSESQFPDEFPIGVSCGETPPPSVSGAKLMSLALNGVGTGFRQNPNERLRADLPAIAEEYRTKSPRRSGGAQDNQSWACCLPMS